jgi:DNA primase
VASVSTPVTWIEVDKGITIADFRLDNVRERIAKVGDLWKALASGKRRVDLRKYL